MFLCVTQTELDNLQIELDNLLDNFKIDNMCFFTKKSKIKIAKQDVECYKNVHIRQNYCSCIFRPFTYTYGITYLGKSKLILFLRWLFNLYVSKEAYHSYTTPEGTNVKCIIPKGSLYLINEEGTEYVSTSIKILKPDWL